jgi:hypothetical protein
VADHTLCAWYALDGKRGELLGELRSTGPPPKLGYKDVNGNEVESCVEVVVITDPKMASAIRADLSAGRIPEAPRRESTH